MWGERVLDREIADGLREFISLIEREEFFEAHEILEAVWHKSRAVNHQLKIFSYLERRVEL